MEDESPAPTEPSSPPVETSAASNEPSPTPSQAISSSSSRSSSSENEFLSISSKSWVFMGLAAVGCGLLVFLVYVVCRSRLRSRRKSEQQHSMVDTVDEHEAPYEAEPLAMTVIDNNDIAEWQCLVCSQINHPNTTTCAECGAAESFSRMSSIDQSQEPRATHPTASLTKMTLLRMESEFDELTAKSRQRALRYRRLNQVQQHPQHGDVQQKQLWQRTRTPDGQFVWVRTVSSNTTNSDNGSRSFMSNVQRLSSLIRSSSSYLSTPTPKCDKRFNPHVPCSPNHQALPNALLFNKQRTSMGTTFGFNKSDSTAIIDIDDDDQMALLDETLFDLEALVSMNFSEKETWFSHRIASITVHFTRSMHRFVVRRQNVLNDSIAALCNSEADKRLRERLSISFENEIDLGADIALREWFRFTCAELFDPTRGLFCTTHQASKGYWINPRSADRVPDHLTYFRFAGRLIGKSLLENLHFEHHFALPLLKHWLGVPIVLSDLEIVDEKLFKSSCWVRDNSGVEKLGLTFSMTTETNEVVDLKPNGCLTKVTDANKSEYLALLLQYCLVDSVRDQLDAMLAGLNEIIPRSMLTVFDYQELDFILCGLPRINVTDWRRNSRVCGKRDIGQNLNQEHPVIRWFWEVVNEFSDEDRGRLMQFVTGSCLVPIQGFSVLAGANGELQPFTIRLVGRGVPPAGLCPCAYNRDNRIDLPLYQSKIELESYLSLVIQMEISSTTPSPRQSYSEGIEL